MKKRNLLLEIAFVEDLGRGDITTQAIFKSKRRDAHARIIAKESGKISGLSFARETFKRANSKLIWKAYKEDGDPIRNGDLIAEIKGPGDGILTAERIALNALQYLSGVASTTHTYVEAIRGTKAKIYDTRKILPGLRVLAKKAVRDGGGENHRHGLYDAFLIKENHIAICGSITAAIALCRAHSPKIFLEVEVENETELREALQAKPDAILLDNFTLPQLRRAVKIAKNGPPLEASGGVTLKNVRKIAETGVTRISIGALTHSVKALDLSLLIDF